MSEYAIVVWNILRLTLIVTLYAFLLPAIILRWLLSPYLHE